MNLYQEVKTDLQNARIMRDQSRTVLYSTLLGEIERDPKKDFSDEAVIRTVRKFIAGSEEVVKVKAGTDAALVAQQEIDLLSQYLPQMMAEADVASLVKAYKESNPSAQIKDVMAHAAQVSLQTGMAIDKSVVSRLFRRV